MIDETQLTENNLDIEYTSHLYFDDTSMQQANRIYNVSKSGKVLD